MKIKQFRRKIIPNVLKHQEKQQPIMYDTHIHHRKNHNIDFTRIDKIETVATLGL